MPIQSGLNTAAILDGRHYPVKMTVPGRLRLDDPGVRPLRLQGSDGRAAAVRRAAQALSVAATDPPNE